MFLVTRKDIKEVEVLDIGSDGLCKVLVNSNGRIIDGVQKVDLEDSYESAELAQKEIAIKKIFRNKRRDKNGECRCGWCGQKDKDSTVDHITPLAEFGGKKKIRKDKSLWEKAWRSDNLQILCEQCNQNKSDYLSIDSNDSLNKIDFHARILNNKKKIEASRFKDSATKKIGYGIVTGKWARKTMNEVEYVAKADSNRLRLDMILSESEAYDSLPTIP